MRRLTNAAAAKDQESSSVSPFNNDASNNHNHNKNAMGRMLHSQQGGNAGSSSSANLPSQPSSQMVLLRYAWYILICSNILVYQLTVLWHTHDAALNGFSSSSTSEAAVALPSLDRTATDNSNHNYKNNYNDNGNAAAATTADNNTKRIDRKFYGGSGDPNHLGGFTTLDTGGLSQTVWRDMLSFTGIRSLLDVGCGKGVSTLWFHLQGLPAVACVEGSGDALRQSLLLADDDGDVGSDSNQRPERDTTATSNITDSVAVHQHDYSRGPWHPTDTVDAVWCVEFLEHVGRNYMHNYLPTLEKAALLFVTSSQWGGWHHVEVHFEGWWRAKFESLGFVYSEYLTERYRKMAFEECLRKPVLFTTNETGGEKPMLWCGTHLVRSLQVYWNPVVARLPKHAHLLSEPGCIRRSLPFANNTKRLPEKDESTWNLVRRPCGHKEESVLPRNFEPLPARPEQEEAWRQRVLSHMMQQQQQQQQGREKK